MCQGAQIGSRHFEGELLSYAIIGFGAIGQALSSMAPLGNEIHDLHAPRLPEAMDPADPLLEDRRIPGQVHVVDRLYLTGRLIGAPLQVSTLPEDPPHTSAADKGRFCDLGLMALVWQAAPQAGRISKISTLCPEIRYPRSSCTRICGGGLRIRMKESSALFTLAASISESAMCSD